MGSVGEVGLDIPPPPPPEKNWGQMYHNGVGVLSSSTYKIDLLADKQKKRGVKEGDYDTFFPDLKIICGKIIIMG